MYRTYIPRPPLSDFVVLLWLYESQGLPHPKERLLPTGTVELVINLRDEAMRVYDGQNYERFQTFHGSLVCGAHSEFFVIDTASQTSVMGVHFKPGGAFPFFKVPAGELHNLHVSLDSLWGAAAAGLREQLLAAETPAARFRLLEQALLAQAALPLARHPAVAFALKELRNGLHPRPIAEVTDQIGLSSRRFSQVFQEEVGLTPKLFCRVLRFQEVLRRIEHAQQVAWADVALSCGYFDQAHFIHDFRAFSGLNPTTYLARRSEHFNHVPLFD
jgi:AraC-like DNA-binding protein